MNRKKQLQIAKSLLKASLKNGAVDTSSVRSVLRNFMKLKPQGASNILKFYKKLIAQKIASETLTIETATVSSSVKHLSKSLATKSGARKVIFKTNPEFVFGARITHGDWIYEDTLESKLHQLAID